MALSWEVILGGADVDFDPWAPIVGMRHGWVGSKGRSGSLTALTDNHSTDHAPPTRLTDQAKQSRVEYEYS